MKRLSFLAFATSMLCSVDLAAAGDPPPPNLTQPVDYMAWIHKEFADKSKANAAYRYSKAIEAFVEDERAYEIGKKSARSWTTAEKHAVVKWVRQNETALAEFHEATEILPCYFEGASETGDLVDFTFPQMRPLRDLAISCTARAGLRLIQGDIAGALDDHGAVLRASRHLRRQPVLISYLVGMALADQTYSALAEIPLIAKGEVDYAKPLKDLAKMDRRPESLRSAMKGELAFQYDLLQRSARDADGDGRIEKIVYPKEMEAGEDLAIDPPMELDTITSVVRDYLKVISSANTLRYPAALAAEQRSEVARKSLGAAADLLDSLWRVEKIRRRGEANRRGTWIILKMHAYRAANGAWPKTLDEAMQGASSMLRQDPFSDGDLVYLLTSGEPKVYSIGADGKDDQGREMPDDGFGENGDIVLWPLSEE